MKHTTAGDLTRMHDGRHLMGASTTTTTSRIMIGKNRQREEDGEYKHKMDSLLVITSDNNETTRMVSSSFPLSISPEPGGNLVPSVPGNTKEALTTTQRVPKKNTVMSDNNRMMDNYRQTKRTLHPKTKKDDETKFVETATTLFVPVMRNNATWILPTTRFTHHITKLVNLFDPNVTKPCGDKITVTVKEKEAIHNNSSSSNATEQQNVTIQAVLQNPKMGTKLASTYATVLERRVLFNRGGRRNGNNKKQQQRIFPFGNVTFYISIRDKIQAPEVCGFRSSAAGGFFSVFNWQEIWCWKTNYKIPPSLPWHERHKIPIWRGTAYVGLFKKDTDILDQELKENLKKDYNNNSSTTTTAAASDIFLNKVINQSKFHKRLQLCHFSLKHPNLVDAKISNSGDIKKEWWQQNSTNGFDKFLPFHRIPERDFYTKYQVQIVMGGLGAAFRTGRIMGQGVAILLQDFPYEEWFIQYLTPWVHYIPLAQDLSDLKERLEWIQDNPNQVHQIAMNGKAFYQSYLSYDAMDEFYYEFIFRLMLKAKNQQQQQQ